MSQEELNDVDAEFAALLGEDDNEEANTEAPTEDPAPAAPVESRTTEGAEPLVTEDAAAADVPATQEQLLVADDAKPASGGGAAAQASKPPVSGGVAAPSGGVNKRPALAGRKRQLTVPSGAAASAPAIAKRPSIAEKAKTITAPKTAPAPVIAEVQPSETEPTPAASTATAAASLASPPKRHKSGAAAAPPAAAASAADSDAVAATAAEETAADGDEEMPDAGEEEEVKSPAKAADKPAKPAAGRKKKGLTVAMASGPADSAATTTTTAAASSAPKPPAPKRKKLAAAVELSSSAAAPAVKLPKPKNAFMIFSDDKRASIKEANPGISVGEIAKQLGEQWKAMSSEDKQVYTDKAIADKERCAAEIAAMDQDLVAAIRKAEVDKRAAGKAGKKAAAAAAPGSSDGKPAITDKAAAKEAQKGAKEAEKSEKAAEKPAEKAAEKSAAAAAKKAEKAAAKAAAKEEANRKKAAFKSFYTSKYKSFKEQNPTAAPDEISGLIREAWEALGEEDQKPYFEKADEEAEALKAVSKPKAKPSSSNASGVKRGRGRKSRAGSDDEAADNSLSGDEEAAAANDDDDSDREDVDWEEHPAAAIIAHTTDGASLLVQRKGVGLNEYGCVNARKAKQQLMGAAESDEPEKMPVSTTMIEEYEQFRKSFWSAVHKRTSKGSIDMEDLEEGSPLEMCYLLGKLQEENQLCCPKGKASKNKGSKEEDFLITVPGLKLSMAMQRIVNVTRREKLEMQQHLGALLQALNAEEGLSNEIQELIAVAAAALNVM